MKLEAHGDRVIVRVIRDPEMSDGGVYIPEGARERSQRGEVISAGPGRVEFGVQVPVPFEVGDVILFSKYGGMELPEGGDKLLVLREADVLAIDRGYMEDHNPMDATASDADSFDQDLDPGGIFHIDQLTENTLAHLVAQVGGHSSARPPVIVCGSVAVELVARRIVSASGVDGDKMGPMFGMFDVRLASDAAEIDSDHWRLEPPELPEADPREDPAG